MFEKAVAGIAGFIVTLISSLGYGGIVLLMAIESACIPLPSEVIMPFSGYLVYAGEFKLWAVAVAGATGCVLGSLAAYAVGASGGRVLVQRYGRYLLMSPHDLELAERWFERYGDITVFIARLLPIVRTFIAFPAGVARMPLWRFNLYTFVGSLLWCLTLAWIGLKLGQNWKDLGAYFHRFDFVVAAAVGIALLWYLRRRLRRRF